MLVNLLFALSWISVLHRYWFCCSFINFYAVTNSSSSVGKEKTLLVSTAFSGLYLGDNV